MSKITVRICPPEKREELESLTRTITGVKDFAGVWERFGNWAQHPPIIAEKKGKICGFIATTISERRKYVNLYYHGVPENCRGQGINDLMLSFLLKQSAKKRMVRIKLKTKIDSLGEGYWRHVGFVPIGKDKKHYVFDEFIYGVKDVDTLRWFMRGREEHRVMPHSERVKYKKQGVEML